MPIIAIKGPARLRGCVSVDGSKNAALPALVACMLTTERVVLRRVPDLRDVDQMLGALRELGAELSPPATGAGLSIMSGSLLDVEPNPERIRKMRASFLLLAPLLCRHGRVTLPLPGGCTIGPRPVDLHLEGLKALGASVRLQPPEIHVSAPLDGLRGTEIRLPYPSVGATEQLVLASTLASGQTVLHGAAIEPEVLALTDLLRSMGAAIERRNDTLVIEGRPALHGTTFDIPPDRIEAGTFLLAAAATGSEITVLGAPVPEMRAVFDVVEALGSRISLHKEDVSIVAPQPVRPLHIEARPFPAFPTDLQPILVASLAAAAGNSSVADRVFPERFGYVCELNRFGAGVSVSRSTATIPGRRSLAASTVTARDLRAGAALVIAGLSAAGTTTILQPHHIDRGYAHLERKLSALGATIERKP